jgi:hypothetical protein
MTGELSNIRMKFPERSPSIVAPSTRLHPVQPAKTTSTPPPMAKGRCPMKLTILLAMPLSLLLSAADQPCRPR